MIFDDPQDDLDDEYAYLGPVEREVMRELDDVDDMIALRAALGDAA